MTRLPIFKSERWNCWVWADTWEVPKVNCIRAIQLFLNKGRDFQMLATRSLNITSEGWSPFTPLTKAAAWATEKVWSVCLVFRLRLKFNYCNLCLWWRKQTCFYSYITPAMGPISLIPIHYLHCTYIYSSYKSLTCETTEIVSNTWVFGSTIFYLNFFEIFWWGQRSNRGSCISHRLMNICKC